MELPYLPHDQQRPRELTSLCVLPHAHIELENLASDRGAHREAVEVGLHTAYLRLCIRYLRPSDCQIIRRGTRLEECERSSGLIKPRECTLAASRRRKTSSSRMARLSTTLSMSRCWFCAS